MKAKYILIVVAVLLLPMVAYAQAVTIQPDVLNTPSQSLSTTVEGIGSVQLNGADYHNPMGISVTRKASKHIISLAPISGTLVASPVQTTTQPTLRTVPTYSTQVWKGEVTAVGSETPAEVRVKYRKPDNPGEVAPDAPAPLGDMPWVWVLLLVVGYGVIRRRIGWRNTNCTN